jgi:putative cardiolipin synthase
MSARANGNRAGLHAMNVVRILIVTAALTIAGCARLPPQTDRSVTNALSDTSETRLGRALAGAVAANPGKSGVHDLSDPHDAFAARGLLCNAAERSIDTQYYIWHGDQTGELLFGALWRAAQRGVRVRLLLDDNGARGLDTEIAVLDADPNIEVRLYNPFPRRSAKALGFVTDFTRLNRRMHNKSFTVDNQASVIGGRNIANEYFKLGRGLGFTDTDVLAVGPIVHEISDSFDLYWNSPSAYPVARIIDAPTAHATEQVLKGFEAAKTDPDSVEYLDALRTTPLLEQLDRRELALEWTDVKLVVDDPAKTLDTNERTDILLYPDLVRTLATPQRTLDIVSPYFVPAKRGEDMLLGFVRSGVSVRILTNSLAANDEPAAHSGYAKHRELLLKGGVQIWELKPMPSPQPHGHKARNESTSSSALHGKLYAVDQQRIFIGSYNFDQRSANLNTEQGLVIDSAALAGKLAKALDVILPTVAWQVRLTSDSKLEWIDHVDGREVRYETEPQTSWWLRAKAGMMSLLPIDWLL